MAASMPVKIFQILAFVVNVFAVWYHFAHLRIPRPKGATFGGRWKYLTFWNMILQTVFYGLCVLNTVFGTTYGPKDTRQRSSLQKTVDRFYACIAWPLGFFVVVSFWALYVVNRELVYPEHLDKFIPTWMNHLMHTTILPLLLVENSLVHHEYPSRKNGAIGCMALAALYIIWIHVIAYTTGHWVYPVLAMLGVASRTVFIIVCLAVFSGLYLSGEVLHDRTWRPVIHRKPMKRQMKAH